MTSPTKMITPMITLPGLSQSPMRHGTKQNFPGKSTPENIQAVLQHGEYTFAVRRQSIAGIGPNPTLARIKSRAGLSIATNQNSQPYLASKIARQMMERAAPPKT